MKQQLLAFQMCLDKLIELNPQMSVQQSSQLVTIALNEGANYSEVAARCGLSIGGVSRNIKVFKGVVRNDGVGGAFPDPWVTTEYNNSNAREKLIYMTESGKEGIAEIAEIIGSIKPSDPIRELLQQIKEELN